MKIDIYKSKKNKSKYLSVTSGLDVKTLSLPTNIDPDLRDLVLFKKDLEINSLTPRIGLDEVEVEKQINDKGYAIHATKIECQVNP
ncbi:hypothetical protein ACU5EH_20860 [Aliivibrio salmonicida]|uniref:hypothetical protein n=1 Tax=Aliivibrio salmonicida TaxID=40269 RepID=UPI00406CA90C